jgi:hypothetical protein
MPQKRYLSCRGSFHTRGESNMTKPERLAIRHLAAASVIVVLTLSLAVARAASDRLPPGTYATTITAQDIPSFFPPEAVAILVGDWQLQFTEAGDALAVKDGQIVVAARYVSNPARLVFHDEGGLLACTDPGTATGVYTVVLQSNQVNATAIHDSCAGRALVMTAHPWQKL